MTIYRWTERLAGLRQLTKLFALLTAVVACAHSPRLSNDQSVPRVSLCDIVANRDTWNGRVVRLRAAFISDMRTGNVLKDKSCPRAILALRDAPRPGEEAKFREFTRALYGDTLEIRLRVFSVDVVGRVVWLDSETPPAKVFAEQIISYHPTTYPLDGP